MRLLPFLVLLTACEAPPPAKAPAPSSTVASPAAIALAPLSDDVEQLSGELACSFSAGGSPLLIARADVADDARAQALIRDGARPVRLTADRAGGFNAMEKGPAFNGDGYRASLIRGPRRETGSEATRHDAMLRVSRADGGSQTLAGLWDCGP